MIITFEGIEGSGKSFHIKNVAQYFNQKKIPFIKIREPGGSKNSEKIFTFVQIFFVKKPREIPRAQ